MLLISLLFSLFTHPLHIGVTHLDYDSKEKALQVTHKFFVDDFEDALEKKYQVKLRLGSEKEHPQAEEFIQKYLRENFSLHVNQKEVGGNWIGKEIDGEAIWMYVEYPKIRKIQHVEVSHQILFETFDDQRNLVHLKYLDFKSSTSCKPKQHISEISID